MHLRNPPDLLWITQLLCPWVETVEEPSTERVSHVAIDMLWSLHYRFSSFVRRFVCSLPTPLLLLLLLAISPKDAWRCVPLNCSNHITRVGQTPQIGHRLSFQTRRPRYRWWWTRQRHLQKLLNSNRARGKRRWLSISHEKSTKSVHELYKSQSSNYFSDNQRCDLMMIGIDGRDVIEWWKRVRGDGWLWWRWAIMQLVGNSKTIDVMMNFFICERSRWSADAFGSDGGDEKE